MMCLNIGAPKSINFPFGTNGKLMLLGVPILKHGNEFVRLRELIPVQKGGQKENGRVVASPQSVGFT